MKALRYFRILKAYRAALLARGRAVSLVHRDEVSLGRLSRLTAAVAGRSAEIAAQAFARAIAHPLTALASFRKPDGVSVHLDKFFKIAMGIFRY